ncbi:DUF222 domain-containing protein [Kytococcus schroeteri]|nr:HNH endonuclease signature motif containing protein [Kytococcus schroeteri]
MSHEGVVYVPKTMPERFPQDAGAPPRVVDGGSTTAPIAPGQPPGSAGAWHEVTEAFAAADQAVDRLLAALTAAGSEEDLPVSPSELEWLTRTATRFGDRGQQVRVRSHSVLATARRAGRAVHDDDAQFAAAKNARTSGGTRRDAVLAEALAEPVGPPPSPGTTSDEAGSPSTPEPGPPTAPGPRPLARALDAGLLSQEHAMVVLQELDALPADVDPALRLRAEEVLVRKAERLTPRSLRRAARRVLGELGVPEAVVDSHQDERVRTQEQKAWEAASFWMRDNGDGTVHGRFTLPALQGHMLGKVLDALVAPRRLARKDATDRTPVETAGPEATGREHLSWKDRQVDWAHEKGKALCELIDHLPTHELGGRTNVTVLVTTTLETLRGETDRAGLTDTGVEVSAGEVRRLAAGAGIVPVVLGGDSVPLDLGRRTRLFTETQRRALALRYTECAEENCDRPFAWCEVHHVDPWGSGSARGGPPGGATDLVNALPLCGRHHRRLEDPSLTHTITCDGEGRGVLRFHRRGGRSRRADQ